MKKRCPYLFSCLVILLFLVFPISAKAVDSQSYTLDELGMTLEIPQDLMVFTREIDPDHPGLSALGLDAETLLEQFRSGHIYLNAISLDSAYEIVVTMASDSGIGMLSDFNLFSDAKLKEIGESVIPDMEQQMGIVCRHWEVYPHPHAKFLRLEHEREAGGQTIFAIQYYTVYDGKAINITLHSYGGAISSATQKTLGRIVESVSFGLSAETASGAEFSDAAIGVTFQVPPGWQQRDFSKEQPSLKIQYYNVNGNAIQFGCLDAWEALPVSDKAGLVRSDISNELLTDYDIQQMLGSYDINRGTNEITKVERERIGGVEYLKEYMSAAFQYGPASIEVNSIAHILFYDGMMYQFQFVGTEDAPAYQDYLEVLKSIRYDALAEAADAEKSAAQPSSDIYPGIQSMENPPPAVYSPRMLILDLLLTISLYTLPIAFYRFLIVKEPVPPDKAKKIAIIYGVAALIVTFIIAGGQASAWAVLFWSWVNYIILKRGGAAKVSASKNRENDLAHRLFNSNPNPQDENSWKCPNCGAVLSPDNYMCSQCGTQRF